jgi:YNFM family putative membrane transporter
VTIDTRRIAIGFAAVSAFLNLYSPQAVLPFMAQEFGVGAAEASRVITASTLAVALTAPFAGALSDLLGRKRVILAAMVLLIVPTVMVALAPTLEQLIFWRFVQGLLLPPIFTVTIAYIGDEWPPAQAVRVIGIYASASAVGGFLGRFVPGVLADSIGWRGGFLVLGACSMLSFAVVILLLPRETHFVRARNLGASLGQMLAHLRNPKLLATYAIGFGVLFCYIATFTFLSFHLAAPPFERSAFFLGSIFVVYLAGSALSLWIGRWLNVVGRRTFVLCVFAVWTGGLLLTLIEWIPAIVLGLVVCSTCGILTQAASTGYVTITARGGTSAAVGLYVTSFYIGGTFGGWLPGLAYEAGGWGASILPVLGMLSLMSVIVATAWKR